MIEIWGHKDAPNVRKVLWAAAELRRPLHRIDAGGRFGGVDEAAYRAMNPNGRVPTIRDGDFVLWESHAIMRYLAETTRDQALIPATPQARARMNQWMDWQLAHQAGAIRALVMLTLKTDTAPDAARLSAARRDADALFAMLDDALSRHGFIAGDGFTLADIAIAIGYERWSRLPIERPAFPHLANWFVRACARPGYRDLPVAA